MAHPLRVLELFCGIGGCAAALGARARIVAAVDINRVALSVYRHNVPSAPVAVRTIESLPAGWYRQQAADLWWLSPPCQPYTSRGRRLDLQDDRAQGLLAVIERLGELGPRYVALENVPGFGGSQSHRRLRETLEACGYRVAEQTLCPTQLGVPSRRRRFYLVASRDSLLCAGPDWYVPERAHGATWRYPVRQILDAEPAAALGMTPDFPQRYRDAIHVVDAEDPQAETHCFTSAYGSSAVHSGSYLAVGEHVARSGRDGEQVSEKLGYVAASVPDAIQVSEKLGYVGLRRFSPHEILRLLGFPADYRLPDGLPLRKAWQLVGNSLSVTAVRHVLSVIPELQTADAFEPWHP